MQEKKQYVDCIIEVSPSGDIDRLFQELGGQVISSFRWVERPRLIRAKVINESLPQLADMEGIINIDITSKYSL